MQEADSSLQLGLFDDSRHLSSSSTCVSACAHMCVCECTVCVHSHVYCTLQVMCAGVQVSTVCPCVCAFS